jgi:hypothetical protein
MASLRRDRDNEGFAGSRVEAYTPDGKLAGHEPIEGCHLLVGSVTAGTYSTRDYWLTTPITRIVSRDEDSIRFETKNSKYTLRR